MKKIIIMAAAVIFVAIQFVRPVKTNPIPGSPLQAPDEVLTVLKASCYDCHSFETRWPWYSQIAPASWLVAHDVNEAREYINFSEWQASDAGQIAAEITEVIQKGEMPPFFYTPFHSGSKLNEEKKKIILDWAASLKK